MLGFKPGSHSELQASFEKLPNPIYNRNKFLEIYKIVLGTNNPGLPDLYQLSNTLVENWDAEN